MYKPKDYVYKNCLLAVFNLYDIFQKRLPLDYSTYYISINDFFIMIDIVVKNKRHFNLRFCKDVKYHTKEKCLGFFEYHFLFSSPIYYRPILKDWIKKYVDYKSNIKTDLDYEKIMPFSEELIFVLFNFFAIHGKCLW